MFLYGKIISSGKGIKKDYDPLCGYLLLDGARMRPYLGERGKLDGTAIKGNRQKTI